MTLLVMCVPWKVTFRGTDQLGFRVVTALLTEGQALECGGQRSVQDDTQHGSCAAEESDRAWTQVVKQEEEEEMRKHI